MSKLIIIKNYEWDYKAKDGERAFLVSDEQANEIKKYIEDKYFKT